MQQPDYSGPFKRYVKHSQKRGKDISKLKTVKQRGKIASFANKERQNLPAVIFILLFLKYLLSHFTGKIDAESGES